MNFKNKNNRIWLTIVFSCLVSFWSSAYLPHIDSENIGCGNYENGLYTYRFKVVGYIGGTITEVKWFVNGDLKATVVTPDINGHFSFGYNFPTTDDYEIVAVVNGSGPVAPLYERFYSYHAFKPFNISSEYNSLTGEYDFYYVGNTDFYFQSVKSLNIYKVGGGLDVNPLITPSATPESNGSYYIGSYLFSSAESYIVTLELCIPPERGSEIDPMCCSANITLTIAEMLCANVVYAYNCETNEYEFSYEGDGMSSLIWNFGDGSTPIAADIENSVALPVSHEFETTGSFDIIIRKNGGVPDECEFVLYSTLDGGGGNSPTFTAVNDDGTYDFTYTGSTLEAAVSPETYTHSYVFEYGDGASTSGSTITQNDALPSHAYSIPGTQVPTFTHTLTFSDGMGGTTESCEWEYELPIITVESPCCTNFAPEVGERYWISGWVEETHKLQVKTYEDAYLELEFVGSGEPNKQFRASGNIIENWQRIIGDFVIPANTTDLKIHLINDHTSSAYFDDIRVHPFNASMKSYVYDPVTLWLTAELDDNNYATFYEYDEEGQLIRIKKETARGVMTIQESRSANPKQP